MSLSSKAAEKFIAHIVEGALWHDLDRVGNYKQSVVVIVKPGSGAGDGTRTRDILLGKQTGPNAVASRSWV